VKCESSDKRVLGQMKVGRGGGGGGWEGTCSIWSRKKSLLCVQNKHHGLEPAARR
jgi:hypothetical protein